MVQQLMELEGTFPSQQLGLLLVQEGEGNGSGPVLDDQREMKMTLKACARHGMWTASHVLFKGFVGGTPDARLYPAVQVPPYPQMLHMHGEFGTQNFICHPAWIA
jgi:hypothetical protein